MEELVVVLEYLHWTLQPTSDEYICPKFSSEHNFRRWSFLSTVSLECPQKITGILISRTAQLLQLTRVKIECFLIRSTDFYEMFIFASPAQFSPLLFYWMVSWWPKWLHGTFLPLAEGNWQVCNYLFNEADLLRPVENIIRDVSTFWPSQRIIKINTEWRTYHLFILQWKEQMTHH